MKRPIHILFTTFLLLCFGITMSAQTTARDYIRLGNREYRQKHYDKAETYYRKSLNKQPSFEAYYNLGNACVMQEQDSTAYASYAKADSLGTSDVLRRAQCQHNMGNIWYAQGIAAYKKEQAGQGGGEQQGSSTDAFLLAVNHYKSALRCNPNDDDTRYNLAMAQRFLKKSKKDNNQQQQQQQQQEKKQEQEQQQKNNQKQPQQQPEQKKDEMSDKAAQQLLNSAKQDEQKVQQKVQNQNMQRRSLEKDW